MKRIIMTALAFAVGAALYLSYLYFRPGAPFPAAQMNRIFHPDERVAHHRGMDKVFPRRDIAASSAPQPLEVNATPLPLTYQYGGETRKIEDFLSQSSTTSLVVLRHGKLLSESYRLGATPLSRFTSWSVAKSFLVTLVGMAVLDKKIASLDDRVDQYVPELKGHAYGEASLKSLMQMASGIKFSEVYTDKFSDINKLFYKVFIFDQGVNTSVANAPREAPAGTRFNYISSDSQVLSWVVSKAMGKPLAQLVQERIWQPLGMQASAYWSLDAEGGTELGYCCLNATSKDYAKLGLQDGRWQGQQLLPTGWVKLVTRPSVPWQEPGAPNSMQANGNNGARGYGMHFWVPKNYEGEYYANGVWGQSIWVSEKSATVIVRTAVDSQYRERLEEFFAVMRAIAN
jgi:CubicO group peptidase (beta-lactamase class C family)